MRKSKINFEKNTFTLYTNINEYKNKKELLLPFIFINDNQVIINIDYFNLKNENREKTKSFLKNLKAKYELSIYGKLTIKNLIFYIRLFSSYKIQKK